MDAGAGRSLARGQWSGPFFRPSLREVPPTVRPAAIHVLAPATEILEQSQRRRRRRALRLGQRGHTGGRELAAYARERRHLPSHAVAAAGAGLPPEQHPRAA